MVLIAVSFFSAAAQAPQSYQIKILSGSSINIAGKTNVSSFSCFHCEEIASYSEIVEVVSTPKVLRPDIAYIHAKSTAFDCGIKQMTNELQDLLCTNSYPYLEIDIHSFSNVKENSLLAHVDLTIAGTKRPVTIPITITRENDVLFCRGEKELNIVDFNITPPIKLMGLVKVKEHIQVTFDLKLQVDPETP